MGPIKTFEAQVRGFPPFLISARTRSQAMAQVFRSYQHYDDSATFKRFLTLCRCVRVPDPDYVGQRILVSGKPATKCIANGGSPSGHYVYFMFDDSDTILCSNPSDVVPMSPIPTGNAG
jgi:hypothetical protein